MQELECLENEGRIAEDAVNKRIVWTHTRPRALEVFYGGSVRAGDWSSLSHMDDSRLGRVVTSCCNESWGKEP